MMYFERGGENEVLTDDDMRAGLEEALDKIGKRKKVLAVPPDITRFHSKAGDLTRFAFDYYGEVLTDILPALGTHVPMTPEEMDKMFPGIPHGLFREHKWRSELATLGFVPGSFISEISGGRLDYDWPAQVNTLLTEGGFDLIFSPGQVVPHEVIGMANHSKNVFVGVGGEGGIHKSHFLAAVHGMERIMGRAENPVRQVLDYAVREFGGELPQILYAQTVIGTDESGALVVRGLFIGDGRVCFEKASALALKVNFTMVEKPIKKCVVYLDPEEFRSTWLGNKSVYRTRMAMADGGELIVLAPGVKEFGEDGEIDKLIRKYGYFGTPKTLASVKENEDLEANLSAAAHLIHGSSEGRFSITYAPGFLSREEVEGVGFGYAELEVLLEKYDPSILKTGWNKVDGEEIFFVANPALGLWAHADRFGD
ncbi:MAG: D-mannonate epimerase [Spirochaetes bacterium]|nr:MAG: D-mannonate epimerase [Spirochaetota bacterium]